MSTRGGRRANQHGRPPLPEDQRKVRLEVYVRPACKQKIYALAEKYHCSVGQIVELGELSQTQLQVLREQTPFEK